ncbi:MAG TPA: hypothetical protein VK800_03205 [Steroidobacteraceae bacterium]|nr:hypothetical protein [Steroidobacteraceae bacterium]
MRELVMVIADLYAPRGAPAAALETATSAAQLPGIAAVARFGERRALAAGWRPWLAHWTGRTELAAVAPAWIAAARAGAAGAAAAGGALWIASPLHLRASLTRVHLEHHGLLRLPAAEAAALAADYALALGEDGTRLVALPCGDFLLSTPEVAVVASAEPARFAGAAVPALPAGAEAAPLRRRIAEIEMWLHDHALNRARQARGALPVSVLWPWGAQGARVQPKGGMSQDTPAAFGRDAWLEGLWHLLGSAARAQPQGFQEILDSGTARAVVVSEVACGLQQTEHSDVAGALALLDERLVSAAVGAVRRGELERLTLIVNDVCVRLARADRWRLWRPRRAALAAFA